MNIGVIRERAPYDRRVALTLGLRSNLSTIEQEMLMRALKLGYRVSWRLVTTTGPNMGNSEPLFHAPDGVITMGEPGVGTSGELIVFVAPFNDPAAKPIPAPPDCPLSDPNLTPPPPAP